MTSSVHVIEADLNCSLPQALANREALGRDIVNLARKTGEAVWFHEYKSDMLGGAPTIMLECSDTFLAEVRKSPNYAKDNPASPIKGLETQRSPKLQMYYMSGGKKMPPHVRKPKGPTP